MYFIKTCLYLSSTLQQDLTTQTCSLDTLECFHIYPFLYSTLKLKSYKAHSNVLLFFHTTFTVLKVCPLRRLEVYSFFNHQCTLKYVVLVVETIFLWPHTAANMAVESTAMLL